MNSITTKLTYRSFQNPLDQWLHDASSYWMLRSRVLAKELQQLSEADRRFLLASIERNGSLHEAVVKKDDILVKTLIEAGANINARDSEGKTPLEGAQTPELFCWLVENGATFAADSSGAMLGFVINKCKDRDNAWVDILSKIAAHTSPEQFCTLKEDHIQSLVKYCEKVPNLFGYLLTTLAKLIENRPNEVIRLARNTISKLDRPEYWTCFCWLIEQGLIKDPLIEQIVTDPDIVYSNAFCDRFHSLGQYWKPSPDFEAFRLLCGNLHKAILFKSLLKTTTLQKAGCVLSTFTYYLDLEELDLSLKQRMVEHIKNLQEKEKSTIWLALEKGWYSIDLSVVELGLDPRWKDPIHNRTFLFTKNANQLYYDKGSPQFEFDLHHVDAKGNNALEHHCLQLSETNGHCFESANSIQILSKMGLRLSDKFPHVELCRQVFPENEILQAFLASNLMKPRKSILKKSLEQIPSKQQEIFKHALRHHPDLKKIFDNYLPVDLAEQLSEQKAKN